MRKSLANVIRWVDAVAPTEIELRGILAREGLQPYEWSNSAGDTYATHSHSYHKVIYVVRGSITFGLPTSGESLELQPGDRLELLPGIEHNAQVGPYGVVCLEAHR